MGTFRNIRWLVKGYCIFLFLIIAGFRRLRNVCNIYSANLGCPQEISSISNVNCTETTRPRDLQFAVSWIAINEVYVIENVFLKELFLVACVMDRSWQQVYFVTNVYLSEKIALLSMYVYGYTSVRSSEYSILNHVVLLQSENL